MTTPPPQMPCIVDRLDTRTGQPATVWTPRECLVDDPAALFDRIHRDCEAPWVCEDCGRRVCPRCEPSPGEFKLCPECAWFGDDDPETAA